MDTFIDKLAQKRNAQEMILANMTAEAVKMEQMQSQLNAYDELMQEIRRVNLKTAENLSEVQDTLKEYMDKLENMQESYDRSDETIQILGQIKELLEDNITNDETKQALEQIKELQEEKFGQTNDFLHKENVKVYRNVQAAVTEELVKQTEELKKSQKENRGSRAVLPLSILILIAVLADVAIHIYEVMSPYFNIRLFF